MSMKTDERLLWIYELLHSCEGATFACPLREGPGSVPLLGSSCKDWGAGAARSNPVLL